MTSVCLPTDMPVRVFGLRLCLLFALTFAVVSSHQEWRVLAPYYLYHSSMNVSALTSIFGEDRTVRPHEMALIINPNNGHIVTSGDTETMDCLGNGVFEEVAATGFRTKVQELKAHGFGIVAYVNTCSAGYLNSAPNGLEPCYFNHCHTGRQGLRRASYVVEEMQKYQATFPGLLDGFFLDDAAHSPEDAVFTNLQEMAQHVRQYPGVAIVHNPGVRTAVEQMRYFDLCDIVVSAETASLATAASPGPGFLVREHVKNNNLPTRFAGIAYGVADADAARRETLAAKASCFDLFYVTNGVYSAIFPDLLTSLLHTFETDWDSPVSCPAPACSEPLSLPDGWDCAGTYVFKLDTEVSYADNVNIDACAAACLAIPQCTHIYYQNDESGPKCWSLSSTTAPGYQSWNAPSGCACAMRIPTLAPTTRLTDDVPTVVPTKSLADDIPAIATENPTSSPTTSPSGNSVISACVDCRADSVMQRHMLFARRD
jgi:hypothetical protein